MARSPLNALRWDVLISTPTQTGNSVTWANTAAYAGVETSFSGPEGLQAGQTTGQVSYVLTFRAEDSVTANSRVYWAGKTLRVQSVRMLNPAYVQALAVEKQ